MRRREVLSGLTGLALLGGCMSDGDENNSEVQDKSDNLEVDKDWATETAHEMFPEFLDEETPFPIYDYEVDDQNIGLLTVGTEAVDATDDLLISEASHVAGFYSGFYAGDDYEYDSPDILVVKIIIYEDPIGFYGIEHGWAESYQDGEITEEQFLNLILDNEGEYGSDYFNS